MIVLVSLIVLLVGTSILVSVILLIKKMTKLRFCQFLYLTLTSSSSGTGILYG